MTLAQELTEVNSAISAVLKRKEYTNGDKTYKSEDLGQLRALKREILDNISFFGSNFTMGQTIEPISDISLVSLR